MNKLKEQILFKSVTPFRNFLYLLIFYRTLRFIIMWPKTSIATSFFFSSSFFCNRVKHSMVSFSVILIMSWSWSFSFTSWFACSLSKSIQPIARMLNFWVVKKVVLWISSLVFSLFSVFPSCMFNNDNISILSNKLNFTEFKVNSICNAHWL